MGKTQISYGISSVIKAQCLGYQEKSRLFKWKKTKGKYH